MEVEYRWYEGDLESVEKNRKQLTDDQAIRDKIPMHLRNSSRWGECDLMERSAQDRLISEFIVAFDKHYGGHFETPNKEKIKVCMDASAGKPWKQFGILKKKDFYQRREHQWWLCLYIHYAHCFNWRENFSAAPKGELTEKEDIDNKKSRVFYVAGVLNDYYASDLCKDFNAAIKRMAWNSVGEVWQYGGFVRFGEEMDRVVNSDDDYVIEESDCSKYDLTAIPFFFRLIIAMRVYFSYGHGYENLRLRLEQLYHQALEKDLIWFDGSVFKTTRGNPSGWKNTTEDNCIRHLFIRWYHFTKTMKQEPDYFWTKVFLRVYSDDSVCIADRRLLNEHDLNASYTFWKTVYKGYVKPLTRDVTDTTYLGARFKKGVKGITYTIAKNKAFWSMCVENRKLTPLELRNRCETIATLVANDEQVLDEFLRFIEPYGVRVNVEKAKFIAGGLLNVCTDFSHVGFSSGYVNFCREAPSSGFKEVTTGPVESTVHTHKPLSRNSFVPMTADKAQKKAKKAAAREARKVAREQVQKMEMTRTRNKAAHNLVNNAIVKRSKTRINWYLITLLDPSRWDEAVAHGLRGIPDFYSHRNHVFCTRTVAELGPSNFDSSGKCNIVVNPTIDDHLGYNSAETIQTVYAYSHGVTVGNSLSFAPYNTSGGYTTLSTPASQSSSLVAGQTATVYSQSQLRCAQAAGNNGVCKVLSAVKDSATVRDDDYGDYHYDILAAANNSITVKLRLAKAETGNVLVTVNTDTGPATANIAFAAASAGTVSVTLPAAATRLNGVTLTNSLATTIALDGFEVYLTAQRQIKYTNMTYYPAQNYDRIKADFTSIRPVAGYLWVKYRGDLTKNGSIAGALIDAGSTPTVAQASDYDSVAGLLHAYEGSATNGGYGIWCPMNSDDTNFTGIDDARPKAPFIISCLDVDDVAAQSFRVEAYFVWEGLTQLQMYAPEPGSVDIEMMNDAFAKLSHFNKFMENDSHLAAIGHFLSNSFQKGKDFVRKFGSTPEGKMAIQSAARLLLSKAAQYGPAMASAAKIALNAAAAL